MRSRVRQRATPLIRHRVGVALAGATIALALAGTPSAAAAPLTCVPPHGDTLRVALTPPTGAARRSWAGWSAAAPALRWIAREGLDPAGRAALAWRGTVWRGPERVTGVARSLVRRRLMGHGCSVLPERRVVGVFGSPVDPRLGALGTTDPDGAVRHARRLARAYSARGRPAIPALELVAVLATAAPGADGMHRARLSKKIIGRYLSAARRGRALLILDVQPGRSPVMAEVRWLEGLLRHPEVSLAIDPEWSMAPGEVPGRSIGSVDARVVNQVSRRMSRIVRANRLPEKLLLVHQFTGAMVRRRESVRPRPGVAVVMNIDGFGTRTAKESKYRALTGRGPWHWGLKLFFEEDRGLMSPAAVAALSPKPHVVVYE